MLIMFIIIIEMVIMINDDNVIVVMMVIMINDDNVIVIMMVIISMTIIIIVM